MYVHALTYLLRGLPPGLTLDERRALSASMPDILQHHSCSHALSTTSLTGKELSTNVGPPSLLHRAAYLVTLGMIALVTFIGPILLSIFSLCIAYAQHYELRQRVSSVCIAFAALILAQCQAVGRKGISLYHHVKDTEGSQTNHHMERNLWLAACSISRGVHQALDETR